MAKILGLPPAYINQIANGKRPVPHKYGAMIETATNGEITRQAMFPDDWHGIWPELIEQKTNRTHPTEQQVRETESAGGRSASNKEAV